MFRAGLYARVSTNDQQTLAMQNRAMREYAARRGWTIALQVREVNSGAARREAREKVLEAARRREIDLVLVWRLDRWGRSVTDLLATLQELEHLGVGFVSLTEALDLTTPAGRAMAGLLAIFAEFEREILRERTRAGLAHARAERQTAWAGRQRRPYTLRKSGNCIAPAQQIRDRPPASGRPYLGAPDSGRLFLAEIGQLAPIRRLAETSRSYGDSLRGARRDGRGEIRSPNQAGRSRDRRCRRPARLGARAPCV